MDDPLRTSLKTIERDKQYIPANHAVGWNILTKHITCRIKKLPSYFEADGAYRIPNPMLSEHEMHETLQQLADRIASQFEAGFQKSPPFTIQRLASLLLETEVPLVPEPSREQQVKKHLTDLERNVYVRTTVEEVESEEENARRLLGDETDDAETLRKPVVAIGPAKSGTLKAVSVQPNPGKPTTLFMTKIDWFSERTDADPEEDQEIETKAEPLETVLSPKKVSADQLDGERVIKRTKSLLISTEHEENADMSIDQALEEGNEGGNGNAAEDDSGANVDIDVSRDELRDVSPV
ncbi:unnamed protein product [Kuraishia capsulata CBS 1993]|uniref:Uncharacterized protein n=1 Tax=Kuraishia capsulata CBS 1993 TaxID=1382522 RepID=W6MK42_9ASCO|nr:uncharacterized protein KUCA_T00002330001 [Kuraishia capsulata CBS 1993]CDK26358.1 unnamed protein product [Kuraishia capsulata CBS 1993]